MAAAPVQGLTQLGRGVPAEAAAMDEPAGARCHGNSAGLSAIIRGHCSFPSGHALFRFSAVLRPPVHALARQGSLILAPLPSIFSEDFNSILAKYACTKYILCDRQ
jgi:hypothetical protein